MHRPVRLPTALATVPAVPGWSVGCASADLAEPYERHGTTITGSVESITWTATGEPLPRHQYPTSAITAQVADAAGERIPLPALQPCPDGSGSTRLDPGPEVEGPAPAGTLAAAEAGGRGGGVTGVAAPAAEDGERAAPPTAVVDTDGGTGALAVVSLVVAVAALGVAASSAWPARRR